ncbi:MAG: ATP-dependent RecD-like DNA helicase [Oscillospiraceae bacterium]|nr:ATP-dependent RecD-like DNA helicase [Oscillospiraceae bacterium]
MQEMERLEGTVLYVTFQSQDTGFTVLELETDTDVVTVVGEMLGVAPGQQLAVQGVYVNHPSFGVQFKVHTYEISLPGDENAMLAYLSSGAVKGIGPVTARRIIKEFGLDAFEVMESDPKRLSQVKGISYRRALEIQQEFQRIYGIQDVIANLASYGLTAAQAIALYGVYGNMTMEMVTSDPFVLCAEPCNLPFEQVDNIAMDRMAQEYDSHSRINGGIMYVLRHNSNNGHCCVPYDRLIETVSAFIGVEPEKVENMVNQCCDEGSLFSEDINDRTFIYPAQLYVAEMVSSRKLAQLLAVKPKNIIDTDSAIKTVQRLLDINYAPNQVKALEKVAGSSVCIITGGPGTGKTTLVKGIISMFEMQADVVSLCAPTGRAAKRLSELSGKEAKTIHRLLEVVPGTRNDIKFSRNQDNPIPCDVLIVDEFSMVDIVLFSQLITAVKDGCRVVLVGDYNQLPAVGPGNILKDLLESGMVPNVQLTDIFRQAQESDIVVNAHAINSGAYPRTSGKTGDYFFIESDENRIETLVASLVESRLPRAYGFDSFEDIQILCPSRKRRGGTQNLNTIMQNILNPQDKSKNEIAFNGIIFREGDKVMQIKNNYDLEYTRDNGETEMGVFNGDIGRISRVDRYNKTLTIRFDDKTYVYEQEFFAQLEHAWAITVHKSQGSEFKAVILCLCDTPKELQYRNLLYTAFTRAKDLLVVAGASQILANMVENNKKQLRYSGVKHFLEEYNV